MPNAPELPTLYHSQISFFSQVLRLVLAEKNIEFHSRHLALGPPEFDNLEPDYVRINPNATVPSIRLGDNLITDIEQYIYKTDTIFGGPKLAGSNAINTGNWVLRAVALPNNDIIAATAINRILSLAVNRRAIKRLNTLKKSNPDLEPIYTAKIIAVRDYSSRINDLSYRKSIDAQFVAAMDTLEMLLSKTAHISEENYTIADTIWTVIVARQKLLDRLPLKGRPNLARWFVRMQARPTYAKAAVAHGISIREKLTIALGMLR